MRSLNGSPRDRGASLVKLSRGRVDRFVVDDDDVVLVTLLEAAAFRRCRGPAAPTTYSASRHPAFPFQLQVSFRPAK